MPKKRTGARLGAKAGARVAPRAGKLAGKAALRAGKGQAKLARAAASPKEPALSRFFKYGLFALAGLAIGSILARSKSQDDSSSSFTGPPGNTRPTPRAPRASAARPGAAARQRVRPVAEARRASPPPPTSARMAPTAPGPSETTPIPPQDP